MGNRCRFAGYSIVVVVVVVAQSQSGTPPFRQCSFCISDFATCLLFVVSCSIAMCIDLINYIVGAIVVLTIGGDDGGGGDGDGQEFA